MIYATVATNNNGYLQCLISQCKKNDVELNIIGLNEKWGGFNWKIKKIRSFLSKQNKNDIVVFMDAYDVILLNNNDIEEKFKSFKKKIVMSVEQHSKSSIHKYFYKKVFNPYYNYLINGGLYMGYVEYLIIYFDYINKYYNLNSSQDDQIIFNSFPYENETIQDFYKNYIVLDINSIIFYNLQVPICKKNDIHTIINKKIFVNSNEPNFIHAPGKRNINNLLTNYDINIPSNMIKSNYVEHFLTEVNTVTYSIKTYYKYFVIEFMIILIIICTFFLIFKRYYTNTKNGFFSK